MWPSAPNSLSRRLNEVKTNLREVGIIIERPVDTITNTRLIEICKKSPEYPVSPEDPNQAQLQLENSGDITRDIDSISPDISPAANSKNYAQNHSSGDSGYTGDIIILLLLLCLLNYDAIRQYKQCILYQELFQKEFITIVNTYITHYYYRYFEFKYCELVTVGNR